MTAGIKITCTIQAVDILEIAFVVVLALVTEKKVREVMTGCYARAIVQRLNSCERGGTLCWHLIIINGFIYFMLDLDSHC